MTVVGLREPGTDLETWKEIQTNQKNDWLRSTWSGEEKSSCDVLLQKEKLTECCQCFPDLRGLTREDANYVSDDELKGSPWLANLGKPLPLCLEPWNSPWLAHPQEDWPNEWRDNWSLGPKMEKKRMRNKKKRLAMRTLEKLGDPDSGELCVPCESIAMPTRKPLSKDHYRTHMRKHPDCPVCRLTKPQATPHVRISDKRMKAFGKIDDKGNLITADRPADAHKRPTMFGHLITADHMASFDEDEQSWLRDCVALTIQDKATYMTWSHPAGNKDAKQSVKGFKKFLGPGEETKVRLCCTDGATNWMLLVTNYIFVTTPVCHIAHK